MSYTDQLPKELYRAVQVRELDRVAIEGLGIPGLALMERAGAAAFELLRATWPEARHITIACGVGNNGGDGYVVARYALQEGLEVKVLQLGDPNRIRGDARSNYERFLDAGGSIEPFTEIDPATNVIVDGLFGTGLEREVSGDWRHAVETINQHEVPVLALDIPSGLHSDTGRVLGVAVEAELTISFIGLKAGMFTGAGPAYCGRIYFEDLEVPEEAYKAEQPAAHRVEWQDRAERLCPRSPTAHKGDFGHVLVIGGDTGFSGAAQMAGEAALRCGAGLVSIATRAAHATQLNTVRPELMCHGVESEQDLVPLLQQATVVAIGPGLGQSPWALELLGRVLETELPLVVDADALNLLAAENAYRENWVLTPHPGEAGRLLGCGTAEIQADRFESIRTLQERYGGVAILKGAGSLILGGAHEPMMLCSAGNPGMASGGMGDVLTGVIAALIAQGAELADAAISGVCLHAAAADWATVEGERGLLATDLMPELRMLVNPQGDLC